MCPRGFGVSVSLLRLLVLLILTAGLVAVEGCRKYRPRQGDDNDAVLTWFAHVFTVNAHVCFSRITEMRGSWSTFRCARASVTLEFCYGLRAHQCILYERYDLSVGSMWLRRRFKRNAIVIWKTAHPSPYLPRHCQFRPCSCLIARVTSCHTMPQPGRIPPRWSRTLVSFAPSLLCYLCCCHIPHVLSFSRFAVSNNLLHFSSSNFPITCTLHTVSPNSSNSPKSVETGHLGNNPSVPTWLECHFAQGSF